MWLPAGGPDDGVAEAAGSLEEAAGPERHHHQPDQHHRLSQLNQSSIFLIFFLVSPLCMMYDVLLTIYKKKYKFQKYK